MRKVVGVKDYTSAYGNHYDHEVLECGHDGEVLTQYRKLGKRRRCWPCHWLVLKEQEAKERAEQAARFDVV